MNEVKLYDKETNHWVRSKDVIVKCGTKKIGDEVVDTVTDAYVVFGKMTFNNGQCSMEDRSVIDRTVDISTWNHVEGRTPDPDHVKDEDYDNLLNLVGVLLLKERGNQIFISEEDLKQASTRYDESNPRNFNEPSSRHFCIEVQKADGGFLLSARDYPEDPR